MLRFITTLSCFSLLMACGSSTKGPTADVTAEDDHALPAEDALAVGYACVRSVGQLADAHPCQIRHAIFVESAFSGGGPHGLLIVIGDSPALCAAMQQGALLSQRGLLGVGVYRSDGEAAGVGVYKAGYGGMALVAQTHNFDGAERVNDPTAAFGELTITEFRPGQALVGQFSLAWEEDLPRLEGTLHANYCDAEL